VGTQVFISYSSKDAKFARAICSALESRGLPCWFSGRDVGPGESFMDAIVNAIGAAKVMVLVFSENANNSDDIKREIVLASSAKLTLIPVRVEDVVPKGAFAYQLATRQWIDLFEDWEAQIERLAKWIAGATSATPGPQASAAPATSIPDSPAIDPDRQPQKEAVRVAEEVTQRKRDDAEAQRIAEDNRRQQAEAQRIAEEQRQQQAEAERLAQEEKERVRAAEAARLAEEETQKNKAAREAAAPSKKEALRRNLTISAFVIIAVVVAIAILLVERPPSNTTPDQVCYEASGNTAIAACTQAIALNPKDEIAYYNRCVAYIRLDNYSAAYADCNQAIALNPKDGNAYSNRCVSNWGLGHYKAGLADCNQAIALDPKNGYAYDSRGATYEKLGENAAAIADYQKALTIDPSDQYAKDGLKRLGASPAAK
jgi:tetratricopeptide (TPR) repeat protein